MHETNNTEITKALLISVDTGEFDAESSMNELCELARTAGAEVVGTIIQRRPAFDPATCIGKGKLTETAELVSSLEASLIIFDHELTAAQVRNIEDILKVRTIDRTTLILDIFAQRAVTGEGRLQVELAQQRYRLPRLAGMGASLSRLGGGIGTRGPGESQLETDRRHIRRRISALEAELKELERRRGFSRQRRRKDGTLTAAVVGYTNAGKSTLMNALTGSEVPAEDKLFATLDVVSRGLTLPDGRTVILFDTVGFISRLPHELVEAFKSTLEEAATADIILVVTDISDEQAEEKLRVTEKLLSELGCDGIPRINVLNKCDLAFTGDIRDDDTTVRISAKNGRGLDRLCELIAKNLPVTSKRMTLLIPYGEESFLSLIRQEGTVLSEEYLENGTKAEAIVDHKLFSRAEKYSATEKYIL